MRFAHSFFRKSFLLLTDMKILLQMLLNKLILFTLLGENGVAFKFSTDFFSCKIILLVNIILEFQSKLQLRTKHFYSKYYCFIKQA